MRTEFFDIRTTISRFIDKQKAGSYTKMGHIQDGYSYLDEFAIIAFNTPLRNTIPFKPTHYF